MEVLTGIMNIAGLNDLILLIATGVLTYLSKHVKNYLEARRECELEKARVDKENNTISNAVEYVKEVFEKEKVNRPELTKIDLALEYMRIVEPKVYDASGNDRLKLIIQRIVYSNKV